MDATPFDPNRLAPLPRPLTPLRWRRWLGFPATPPVPIGRARDVATLRGLLLEPRRRLITVTGPGGVGKTRLALAVAEEVTAAFTDGAAFVALTAIRDRALLLPTIARVLDVREQPGRPLRDTLLGALRERHLLLVLDNFEHLAGAAATADVAALVQGCPELTLLVTSRTPLRLHEERRFATPALALPPATGADDPALLSGYGAIALFVERARLANHAFQLTAENAPAVVEICRRLDGLPLAIELAAAWARVLPAAAILARLEPRLTLLHGGAVDQPARLRTMRDAIAWSYDLLTADEQRLFRRLAVFDGGFTLEAAEYVGGRGGDAALRGGRPHAALGGTEERGAARSSSSSLFPPGEAIPLSAAPPSILDLLASLIDKSLLQQTETTGAEPRFMMLETVREFARERLLETDEAAAIASAHALYVRDLAERLEPLLLGPEERRWRARCDAELGNLRAALSWSLAHDIETALRIAAPLWVYWSVHHLAEGRRWLQAALTNPSPVQDMVRAKALTTDAALACLLGEFAASETSARAAAALLEGAGDPIGEARARWIIGGSRLSAGQTEGVAHELDRSLTLFQHATTPAACTHAAYARGSRASLAFMLGDVAQGVRYFEEALAQVRDTGSAGVTIYVLSDFAGWLVNLGHNARARQMLAEALALAAGQSEYMLVAMTLTGLGMVAAEDGAAETAARFLGAAETMRIRSGLVFPAFFLPRCDRARELACAALGAVAFSAAWEAGRLDPDGVIAAALEGIDLWETAITRPIDEGAGEAARLSRRERQVLTLLIDGRSDREIAEALFIGQRTASAHVSSILHKLRVSTRAEAAVRAVRDDLV